MTCRSRRCELRGVTVNGSDVDSFDAAGNYFTSVVLAPGANVFTVEAIDSTGGTAQEQITLVGVAPSEPDFEEFNDVTALAEIGFVGTTFNRQTNTLHAQTMLMNDGDDPLRGPVRVVFNRFDSPLVDLLNASHLDPAGRPTVEFDAEIPAGGLAAGATSVALPIDFANAPRVRFDLDVTVLALGNAAPDFSSVPITDATLGVEYRYVAAATDPDGDALNYRLDLAPNGMIADPATGVVTWSPAQDQLGVHSVRLIVEDGFGGLATQSFQVSVPDGSTNRSPVFTTVPTLLATPGEGYRYVADAFRPGQRSTDVCVASGSRHDDDRRGHRIGGVHT